MSRARMLTRVVALLTLVRVPLLAQEPADKLTPLQTKEALTDEDRATIRAAVSQHIATVVGTDPLAAQAAFRQLRGGLTGNKDFKDAYVGATLDAISSTYKTAQAIPAARLFALLNVYNDPRSIPLLLEGLQDERTAVRAAAAVALGNLRSKIAADADALARTVGALREAGKKEASREALQLIYEALNLAEVQPTPDLKSCAAALLDILEERIKQYDGGPVRGEGAEATALQVGRAVRKAFDEAERKRYAVVLARLLHYGVKRYTSGDAPLGLVQDRLAGPDALTLRNATEVLVKEAEAQLSDLLAPSPAPQVAETMTRSKKLKAEDLAPMVAELNKWILILNEKLGLDLPPLSAPAPGAPVTKPAAKPGKP